MEPKLTAHCTVVVAAAGYGKTEAVRRWLEPTSARWQAGPGQLSDEGPTPGWVVLDDLAGIRPGDLRERLARLSGSRVVLVSRWPLPNRLPVPGPIEERGPADLALDPAGTAEILRREYGLDDPHVAAEVHEQTAGWLALVRLAGERFATSLDRAQSLGAPGTGIATFLDKHVLSPLPPAVGRLVRDLAHLATVEGTVEGTAEGTLAGTLAGTLEGVFDEDLCGALGHRRPSLTLLTRIGLVADARLIPLVAEVARDRWPLTNEECATLFRTAGDWYAAGDRFAEAVDAYGRGGAPSSGLELLRRHGPTWVIAGGAPAIAAAIGAIPSARSGLR